ncbi:MAG: hypothetical protein Kow0027_28680 [Saprospiraceae bacterium]|jgi:mono/diheme cytochrome c family protein
MKSLSIVFSVLLLVALLAACHDNPYKQGELYYTNLCANCHMEDGGGLELLVPPLAGADFVRDHPEKVACIIRNGMSGKVVVNGIEYEGEMPAVPELTDFEIVNVINFINKAWGNDYPPVTYEQVKAALENCE